MVLSLQRMVVVVVDVWWWWWLPFCFYEEVASGWQPTTSATTDGGSCGMGDGSGRQAGARLDLGGVDIYVLVNGMI